MQLLNVITARSIWLFPVADLNPTGKSIESELIEWLKGTYGFHKYPSSPIDFDSETKTLTFAGGRFKSGYEEDGSERFIAVDLAIYTDGLVANTKSSTEQTDKFLDEALQSAVRQLRLTYPETIRRKQYFSEMEVGLGRPLTLLNPKLADLARTISSLLVDARQSEPKSVAFEFSGVTFLPEPAAQPTTSGFVLERKINTDWSENRYYTRAPLQTPRHLQVLEAFESLLA